MSYGLTEKTVTDICMVFSHYSELKKVIVYGSSAKGTYRNGSDIDLTCVDETLNLSILYKIELEIDDLLLPYTFDISIMS